MQPRRHSLLGGTRQRLGAMAVVALAAVVLPVVGFGAATVDAATVAVSLDCGDYDFDTNTFPVQDVTVAQGDTVTVSWDADCIHPTLDETVLRTDAAVADAYFSSVPGQASGVQSGWYQDIVPGASTGTWVLRYDAPLGQMPLNTVMDDSWPVVCSNCALGGAVRMTVTPGPTVPAAPEAPSATPGDGSVELTWSVPADDGGSPVTGYTVTASPSGATCTTTAPVTRCTIEGLTNGVAQTFAVVASNVVGDGPASAASASVTPMAPAAPTTTAPAAPSSPAVAPISFVG